MKTFKLLFIILLLTTISVSSCKKDSDSNPTDLSGTQWKSLDVDPQYEEYVLLKFKTKTTFEVWWKDKGDPIYMESEGTYSISGNTITLNNGDYTETGEIDGNTISVAEDGTVMTFTKQ